MRNPHCRWSELLLAGTVAALVWGSAPGRLAAEGWTDTRSAGPFVCRANFPLGDLAAVFQDLSDLQNDLVRYLGIAAAQERIELYLFRDETSYRAYLAHYLPKVPYRPALYVKVGSRGMVFAQRGEALEIDLRHECTHALLHAALPLVPLWLDEGLAEYFEVPSGDRLFRNPHLASARWLVPLGAIQKIEKLEKKTAVEQMGASEYRSSWAWVHFMFHGPFAAHDELVRYFRGLQRGEPAGPLSQRLRQRIPDLDQQFATHFRTWKK